IIECCKESPEFVVDATIEPKRQHDPFKMMAGLLRKRHSSNLSSWRRCFQAQHGRRNVTMPMAPAQAVAFKAYATASISNKRKHFKSSNRKRAASDTPKMRETACS